MVIQPGTGYMSVSGAGQFHPVAVVDFTAAERAHQ